MNLLPKYTGLVYGKAIMFRDPALLKTFGLDPTFKYADGSVRLEGPLTPELIDKLVSLKDLLTVHDVMEEGSPVKLSLTVPSVIRDRVVETIQNPDDKYPAQ